MARDLALRSIGALEVNTPQPISAIVERLERMGPVTLNGPLVPAEDCRRMIAAFDQDEVVRPTPEHAAVLGKKLIGSFGSVKVHDLPAYVDAICAALEVFPLSIVETTCHPINGYPGSHKFAPNSPAELAEYMNGILGKRRELKVKATAHIREAERRRKEREEEAALPSPERRKQMADELRQKMARIGQGGEDGEIQGIKEDAPKPTAAAPLDLD